MRIHFKVTGETTQRAHTTMWMFVRVVQAVLSPITFPPAGNALGFILTPELRPENNPFPASLKPRRTPQTCVNEMKHER